MVVLATVRELVADEMLGLYEGSPNDEQDKP